MSVLKKRWVLLAASVVIAAGTCGVISATVLATPVPPQIAGVSSQSLAATGITLQVPQESAGVSEAAAAQSALSEFPNAHVLSETLATVYKPVMLPTQGRLCWVISITPPMATVSGGPGTAEVPVRYFLVFIDAATGQFLFFHYYADVSA